MYIAKLLIHVRISRRFNWTSTEVRIWMSNCAPQFYVDEITSYLWFKVDLAIFLALTIWGFMLKSYLVLIRFVNTMSYYTQVAPLCWRPLRKPNSYLVVAERDSLRQTTANNTLNQVIFRFADHHSYMQNSIVLSLDLWSLWTFEILTSINLSGLNHIILSPYTKMETILQTSSWMKISQFF